MFKLRKMLSVITAAVLFISILTVLPLPESTARAAQPFTVVLNPGHGPASTGSGAVAGGVKESALNEQLTAHVVSALKARGINVIVTNKMTSVANEAPYMLDERPAGTTGSGNSGSSNGQYHFKDQLIPVIQNPSLRLAGVATPNLLITLHHNSTASSSVRGYEIYYSSTLAPDYGKTSDTVARSADFANMVDRQFAQPGFYLARRGVFDRENNSLTKYPSIPSVLVEAGYMSNGSELSAVRSSANQAILADRLANAVSEYAAKYGNSYPAGTPQSIPVSTEPIKAASVKAAADADKITLTASANGVTGAVKEVNFAVWPTGRQDLIRWFQGTKSGNDYSINVNMRDIGNIIGNYSVHVYAKDYSDKDVFLGTASANLGVKASGTVKILKNADGISLSAMISNLKGGAGGVKDVKVAVWPNGRQDLLIWVNAVKSGDNYSARINMRDVGNIIGKYTVHVYAEDYNGTLTGIGAGTVSLGSKPKASSVKVLKNADGVSLSALINGVTGGAGGIKDVKVAVWPNGRQDLLTWVTAVKSGDNYSARINMADVGNIIGDYTVHIYAEDNSGAYYGIGAGKVSLGSKPKASSVKVLRNADGVSLSALINGVTGGAGGIKDVKVAVWPNGRQDLLTWVTAVKSGDNYSARINMRDVGNIIGDYTVHIYAEDNSGAYYGIGAGKVSLGSKPKASSVKVLRNADGVSLSALINGVSGGAGGVKDVQIAVWPDGRQDLLTWVTAVKSGDNYSARINMRDIGNITGNYTVHIYATDYNGTQTGIGAGKVALGQIITPVKGGAAKINVGASNPNEATLTISNVTGGTGGVKQVQFAVWPTSDFGKLQWLNATRIGADWATEINISQFGNTYGNYTVHVYATDNNGDQYCIGSASADLGGKVKTVSTNRSVYETTDMTCYIRPGFKAQSASVAVWSENGGQDDIQWISARYDAATDQWIANVQLNTFTSAGVFDVHAYAVNSAGKQVFINATTVNVKASAFNGYKIMGHSSVTAQQLANYITSKGWDNNWYGMTALQFAQQYIDICNAEGVKAEVAFAQMCHETRNLQFGGDVTRDQYNFAGLGTTGGGVKGIYFANVADGIKSQVQHLKRYASTDSFVLSIAPGYTRYQLVTPGCAPTVELLAGKWASDPGYSTKILNIIDQLIKTSGAAPRTSAASTQTNAAAPSTAAVSDTQPNAAAPNTAAASDAQPNAAAPSAATASGMKTNSVVPNTTVISDPQSSNAVSAMLIDAFEIIGQEEYPEESPALLGQVSDETAADEINPDAELKEEIINSSEEAELVPIEPAEDNNAEEVNDVNELPDNEDKADNSEDDNQLSEPEDEKPAEPSEPAGNKQPSEPSNEEEQGEDSEDADAAGEGDGEPEPVNTNINLIYFNPQTQATEHAQFDVSDANPEIDEDALLAAAAKLAKSDAFKTEVIKTEEPEDGVLRVHLAKPVETAAALSEDQVSDSERAALAALADVYLFYIDGVTNVEFVINDAPYNSANLVLEAGETFKEKLENVVRG